MPHVRQVTQALELGAALFEQSTRQIEIAQPHVHVAETEQRPSLESGISRLRPSSSTPLNASSAAARSP
jgi:hypothetical protein